MAKKIVSRILMARNIADRWVESHATPEYRTRVFHDNVEGRKLANLLRSFRDGDVKIASVLHIADLGIEEDFDSVVLWSKNKVAFQQLIDWFEKKGYETSGCWS